MPRSFANFFISPSEGCSCNFHLAANVLRRISLSGFPIGIELGVLPDRPDVIAIAHVTERDTGEQVEVCNTAPIREFSVQSILSAAREAVVGLVQHEVLEHFKFDGRRIFDPHASMLFVSFDIH